MAFRTNKMPVLQEKSASGAVASFNTALAMPLASCNIAVNAWQEGSGDPSPYNVRPIHGFSEVNATRAGKNLLNPNAEVYYNYTINDDGSENTQQAEHRICTDYLPCKPSTKYVVSSSVKATPDYLFQFIELVFYDRNKNYISRVGRSYYNSSLVATAPVNAAYLRVGEFNPTVSLITPVYFSDYQRQLEIGETATDYTPFVAFDTYTIQLGQEVYGAEVDVVNGVAHVTHKVVDIGSRNLTYFEPSSPTYPYGYFRLLPTDKAYGISNMMCEYYKTSTQPVFTNDFTIIGTRTSYTCYFIDSQHTADDLVDNKAPWLNGYKLVYELYTPFDIQLTPTQIETIIGNNTIFADTGDVDLTYKDLDIAKRGSFREVFKLPS